MPLLALPCNNFQGMDLFLGLYPPLCFAPIFAPERLTGRFLRCKNKVRLTRKCSTGRSTSTQNEGPKIIRRLLLSDRVNQAVAEAILLFLRRI